MGVYPALLILYRFTGERTFYHVTRDITFSRFYEFMRPRALSFTLINLIFHISFWKLIFFLSSRNSIHVLQPTIVCSSSHLIIWWFVHIIYNFSFLYTLQTFQSYPHCLGRCLNSLMKYLTKMVRNRYIWVAGTWRIPCDSIQRHVVWRHVVCGVTSRGVWCDVIKPPLSLYPVYVSMWLL